MTLLTDGTFDFESQTPNAPIVVAAPWVQAQAATPQPMIASSEAAMHGTLGGRIESAAANAARRYGYVRAASLDPLVIDTYLRVRNIAANAYILALGRSNGTAIGDVRVNVNGTVTIRNAGVAVATSSIALDWNKWYRVAYGTVAQGTQELRMYEGEDTEPLFTLSGPVATTDPYARVDFGMVTASEGLSIDFDTARVGDDWFAPVNPAVPIPDLPLTLGAKTNVSAYGGSDGGQVISWAPVSGAARYRVEHRMGALWSTLTESGTSPYTLTGLYAGSHQVRVTALAE